MSDEVPNTVPDPEIVAALEHLGVSVRGFECLSNIRSPEIDRIAYRIDHDQGTIKARRLESEGTARRQHEIRRQLPAAFAPVLSRYGRVLLEEWIAGEMLSRSPPANQLVAAGHLLGDLHALPSMGGRAVHEVRDTAGHVSTARESLRHVLASGAILDAEARRLVHALEWMDPHRAAYGVVHLDFCGENMVIDRTGKLRLVDNERIGREALGFDLARSWYRWALPASGWNRFCSAYATRLPVTDHLKAFRFWQVVAVSRAAALRLRVDPKRASVPIDRLRELAVGGSK